MSRIGKQPISFPSSATVMADGRDVVVKGPRGEVSVSIHPDIAVTVQEGKVVCAIAHESRRAKALWGTTRALLANAVHGVTEGYTKQLELHGVGLRASVAGNTLQLQLGYSHPVSVSAPDGIRFVVEKDLITVEGSHKERVGQLAADIRALRPPEPYKGTGIRYRGEKIRRKVGKVVGTTT